MAKLLALDLSTDVGHAVMERGRPPLFGTLRLVGDRASQHGRFLGWIEDMHMVHRFDACAWERPIITPKDKVDKLELLYGLVGVAYAFVGRHSLPWCEVGIQEAKFALTGKAKADKVEMLAAAMNDLNWKTATHHEADAGAVGLCAYERLFPKARAAA